MTGGAGCEEQDCSGLDMSSGMVFDTLEQGSIAAMNGHGIAIADLHLTLDALKSGLLGLPFREAIATGMATTSSGQKIHSKERAASSGPAAKPYPGRSGAGYRLSGIR